MEARAIQIVKSNDHIFEVDLENLKQILGADDIKDRYVVVISIAGALRTGKSFLLNFMLKYLRAKYKNHDVSNWVSDEIDGFKFRGGQQPETIGIWMWSEIFTHDFPNGEKVAIILLDTQGIFDNRSTTKDNTKTFAISMMLASVQCFNVFQQVQENDLQNLELFSEYGRISQQSNGGKSFQKLLFIVRDWPHTQDNDFGDGQSYIDDILTETSDQSTENQQLRQNIRSSFKRIGAFLLPHPGIEVANGHFNGDLQQIDREFVKNINIMVPMICAPENLMVKEINGQKLRARDLITYLPAYVELFNGGALPKPQSILMATVITNNMMLYAKCLKQYIKTMRKQIEAKELMEDKPYFEKAVLENIHKLAKEISREKFELEPKLGSDDLVKPFRTKLINDIDNKFAVFNEQNDKKRENLERNVELKMQLLFIESYKLYIESMQKALLDVDTFFSPDELQKKHENMKYEAIEKFKKGKISSWSEYKSEVSLADLNRDIEAKFKQFEQENETKKNFASGLSDKTEIQVAKAKAEARAAQLEIARQQIEANSKNTLLYHEYLDQYLSTMRSSMSARETYLEPLELRQIHEEAKRNALSQFESVRAKGGDDVLFNSRLENVINTHYIILGHENDRKYMEIQHKNALEQTKEELQNILRNFKPRDEPEQSFISKVLPVVTSIASVILPFLF